MIAQDAPETSYGTAQWRALGTYVQLVVEGSDRLPEARAVAVRLLDDVDRSYSRFRDDSDLMRANRNAGSWTRVDPLLLAAVAAAVTAAEQTDGLVNPTLGRSMVACGYDRDYAAVRLDDGPAAIPIPAVTDAWRWIELDEGAIRVPHGVALDLGATGKAFAADLIAAAVVARTGTGCVLSLGGDVAVGRDPTGTSGTAVPWQVAISEVPDDDPAAVVTLPAGGLATSTVLARRWLRGGQTVHHLLDPATGAPVQPWWRTASVIAPTCLAANTASTATILLGGDAADWLTRYGVAARLVAADGSVHHVGGWTDVGGCTDVGGWTDGGWTDDDTKAEG